MQKIGFTENFPSHLTLFFPINQLIVTKEKNLQGNNKIMSNNVDMICSEIILIFSKFSGL